MLLQVIKLSEAECEVVSLQRGGNTIGFAGNHKSQTKGVATSRHCPVHMFNYRHLVQLTQQQV